MSIRMDGIMLGERIRGFLDALETAGPYINGGSEYAVLLKAAGRNAGRIGPALFSIMSKPRGPLFGDLKKEESCAMLLKKAIEETGE